MGGPNVMPVQERDALRDRVQELEIELSDALLLYARAVTTSGPEADFDSLLQEFGYTREQLDAMPDEDEPHPEGRD
jgi:hypothetical protein